ncbi:alpha/beta fold hydrolase [Nocardia sp. NPDC059180]|uniref:alpha/beta fold hydrolase n=1 Tax=Nocardia sp. NPDC059180 TaxID=3346761 RepID=UPI0036B6F26F
MPSVTTQDNVELFYNDWGGGSPVLFTHSWSLSSAMWVYQMTYLAERGLRCIAYDRRGHGRSEQTWEGYNFDTLADDMAAVIEHLDLRDLTLVGHSTGTGEVIRYLSQYGPEKVSRIVLVSTLTPMLRAADDYPQGIDGAFFDGMREKIRVDLPGWVDEVSGPFFGSDATGASISPSLIEWSKNDTRPVAVRSMLELSHTMSETDFRTELEKVSVPALIIHGGADAFNPVDLCGRGSADLIPFSQLRIYKDGPHGLHLTHMDQLNADLHAFITERHAFE